MLAVLAVLLAWPIPLWLQQATWPSRAPGAALILWQAIGLSGGLSLVSAPLTWGLQPFGPGIISAVYELWVTFQAGGLDAVVHDPRWHPLGFAAITLGCIIFGHLALVLLHTAYRTFVQRKKHREFVEVLSASLQDDYGLAESSHRAQITRVLPVDHPLAYCLPAVNQPLTIVSQGLLDKLSPEQLGAVLTHEAAHLTQRHDLLRLAFQSWHKAAPWLPVTSVAVEEVTQLTEILADDVTLARHKREDLTTALVHTLTEAETPQTATRRTSEETTSDTPGTRRLSRLIDPEPSLNSGRVSLVVILAMLLVIGPAFISLR